MGRWSYLDTDEERLPEGFRRIGYDDRTQTYTYADSRGQAWEGVPGARYGTLHRASTEPRRAPRLPTFEADEDALKMAGDEPAYVLHDYDGSDGGDDDDGDEKKKDKDDEKEDYDEKGGDDEKGGEKSKMKSILKRKGNSKSENQTFDSILGGAKSPAPDASSEPKKGKDRLRRWSSLSRAASVFIPKLPPLPGDHSIASRGAGVRVGGELKSKSKREEQGAGDGDGEKPLPPLPSLPRRRASTVSTITREVAQGVKQMFSEESGYRSRRA